MKLIKEIVHAVVPLDELNTLKELKAAFQAEQQALAESQLPDQFKEVVARFMQIQLE